MTDRGQGLLAKMERINSLRDKQQIQSLLEQNKVGYSEAIIEFQVKYGGLIFYSGLEPVCWGIHHLSPRGEFKYMNKEIIVFKDEDCYPDLSVLCADTLLQITWSIDSEGVIFEDFEILASGFDKVVEDFALWMKLRPTRERRFGKEMFMGRKLVLFYQPSSKLSR